MDHSHSPWNYWRSRSHVAFLSAGLICAAAGGYWLNNLFVKPALPSVFVCGYLNDCLAGVMITAIAALLMVMFAPCPVWRKPWVFLIVGACAALYWEYVTPLYTESVSDSRDLVAYGSGAVLFLVVSRRARRKAAAAEQLPALA